ncbi:hypothetical protein QJQ45_022706 [Haematococcus lacustris]|nr:hypothetical protein QJQ45_022706 [Haematococcus lacustris]
MRRSSLLLASRSTMLASRSISATAHQPVTRRAPCSALRPARLNIKAMATNQTSLNKDTPESVWKTILSAEDVGASNVSSSCHVVMRITSHHLPCSQYRILRNKGTEAPGSGTYNKFYDDGTYVCKGCGTPLYTSEQKFNSGCGWPAYYDNIPVSRSGQPSPRSSDAGGRLGAVERHEDTTHGMRRVEITCSNCGGHLGHVFEGEGFPTPTDMRHCVNSASVKFKPKE